MKKFLFSLLALATFSASSLRAENIDWAAVFGNVFRLENNQLNPNGNAVLLGHFGANGTPTPPTFFQTNQTFSLLLANFVQYDSTTIGTGVAGSPGGEFFKQTGNVSLPGSAGDQLFMWVFNNSNPAAATQWAIVTNPLWTRPATGANTTAFDIADGVTVPPGALGALVPDGFGGFDVGLRAIPEPSTYALFCIGAAGFLAIRRRLL